ncbi:MAG TPA: hypothetical protein DCQ51_20475 [Planktothrix sp. UBA8407]|nr:hypothetical protein [Planktothrix sp. UBA8407]
MSSPPPYNLSKRITIVLAKLPQMSRQKLEAMFGVDDLRKTRFAQELIEETEQQAKFKIVSRLLRKGISIEEIAELVELEVEQVRQFINTLN